MPNWQPVLEWEAHGARCKIIAVPDEILLVPDVLKNSLLYPTTQMRGKYNGYAAFPKRPLKEEGYWGIVTYVPVHGGVTYAQETDDGWFEYGFDCGHAGDPHEHPWVDDLMWMKAEVERMAAGISAAVDFESQFLNAITEDDAGHVLNAYHWHLQQEYGIEFDLPGNFGAMINALTGRVRNAPPTEEEVEEAAAFLQARMEEGRNE